MTEDAFLDNGSEWDDELSCAMGFAGNANSPLYSLEAGESIRLNLEDLVAAADC